MKNAPECLSARFSLCGVFMSGHPVKPRQYVKIFTYWPTSATDKPDERHAAGRLRGYLFSLYSVSNNNPKRASDEIKEYELDYDEFQIFRIYHKFEAPHHIKP